MTTTITTRPAASYVPLRTATAALAELLERYADVDFENVELYDNDGPTIVLTPADDTAATAERIAADLNLGDPNEYGTIAGFSSGLGQVWVSIQLPAEDVTRAQRLWWCNRSRVIATALLAAGYTAGRLTRRWRS